MHELDAGRGDDTEVDGDLLDVSVVLPLFNRKRQLAAALDRIRTGLDASSYSYEIIVVDDGSTDGSGGQLRELDGIRLIQFDRPRGMGWARKAGTEAARGRVVVWTEAEPSYPNDRVAHLVDELEGSDQVVAARTAPQGPPGHLRGFARSCMRRLASYLVETKIPDLTSGMRAFRASVGRQYLHLFPPGPSSVTTITMAFLANGYSVKYVPIEWSPPERAPKIRPYRDTKRFLIQATRMVLSYNPLRFFLPIVLLLGVIGLGKGVLDLFTHDLRLTANTLFITFAAFQLLVIGLLADLFVRGSKPKVEIDPATPSASEQDFIQLVRISLSYNPMRVYLPFALTLGAVGVVKVFVDWSVHDFRLTGNTLLILFAALQILGVGLLADLSVRLAQPRSEVDPSVASTEHAVPLKQTYTSTGNTYDKYATVNPIERRLMATFLAQLDDVLPTDAPLRILEVGVGEGEVADRVVRRYPDAFVTGIDLPDPTLADHWSTKGFAASFADIEALPFCDGTFDLVLAIEVLEHVPNPGAALRELGRVARSDLVLSVPREPIWRVANMARGKYWSDLGNTPGHVQHWSRNGFVRLVRGHLDVTTVRSPMPWTMLAARTREPTRI